MREHDCGAYPAHEICSRCSGVADRGDPAAMQGVWYYCRGCSRTTLLIDWCECDEDES